MQETKSNLNYLKTKLGSSHSLFVVGWKRATQQWEEVLEEEGSPLKAFLFIYIPLA